MKIIWVSPFGVVYDATPHYYQAVFSAAAQYVRDRLGADSVAIEAAGFHGATERTVIRHFVSGPAPDYLVLWCRPWESRFGLDMARTIRSISPTTRIVVWGDACNFIPHYFQRPEFDLIVVQGDPERVIADAVERLNQGLAPQHGVLYRDGSVWHATAPGQVLEPELWPFPAPDAIDPEAYRMSRVQRGKSTDDLSFMVSRGCPINCAKWCPTPRKEGLKDRRRPARATVEYMRTGLAPYEMFQMHSPLFAMDREWVDEFVRLKREICPDAPFKVVDLMNPYAEERLVAELAEVGMRNVGFGVETLSLRGERPLISKVNVGQMEQVAQNFQRYRISAKAYVQIGLPGQTRADLLYTLKVLTDLGIKPRFTGSTPFWKLASMSVAELDQIDLRQWDRKSYYDPRCGLSQREFYQLITAPSSFVMEDCFAWAA
jgi:radical SAM superfamily enzyme YgiQ (UPF0313 family)